MNDQNTEENKSSLSRVRAGNLFPIVMLASLFYCMLLFLIAIRRYEENFNIHDLFIFESSFWNTLQGRLFFNFYEFGNHLGVHFSPGLFFLVPFYAVFPSPLTLLFLQSAAIAFAGVPLYVLAKTLLKENWAALFITFAYWCYAPTLGTAFSGFHEDPFALPFLFALVWAFEAKRFRVFWIFAFILLLWKETLSFVLFFFGLSLLFHCETRRKGLLMCILSLLWGVWSIGILMPMIRGVSVSPGLIQYRFPGQIGHSFVEIVTNFFKHPLVFFSYAFQKPKMIYLFFLFAPLGFMPLLSPSALVPLAPQLAQNLLSRYLFGASLMKHYTALMIPFFFYALLKTLVRVRAFLEKKNSLRFFSLRILSIFLFALCAYLTLHTEVFRQVFCKERADTEWEHYLSPYEVREAKRLGSMIPRDASLAVSGHLDKYFARRKVIAYISAGFIRIFPFDYLLYYSRSPEEDLFRRYPDLEKIRIEQYELVEKSGRLALYRRLNVPYSLEHQEILEGVP
jgi:uncharacterized membrane protein